LVKHHMRVTFGMGGKAVRRLLKDLQDDGGLSWRDLLRVRAADRFANLGKDNYGSLDFREMIGKFWRETKNPKHVPLSIKSLALNGNDVMEVLGLKPSPKVGEVLDNLLEIVLDDPTKNTVPTLLQELVRMKV
jgi:tRNA nucleotidyltransferase (CCA-adding enzyme)